MPSAVTTSREALHVMVGLLEDAEGRVLVNERRAGTHMAGFWEFPGGKRAVGEGRWEALRRELDEELGVTVLEAEPFLELVHDYPERTVTLDVWLVRRYEGEPSAREQQPLRWVAPRELACLDLLPADWPIMEALLARRANESPSAEAEGGRNPIG